MSQQTEGEAINDLDKSREVLNDIRAIRAEQCLRCGKAYRNKSKTHDWRGWGIFRRPRCEYDPKGWDYSDHSEGIA